MKSGYKYNRLFKVINAQTEPTNLNTFINFGKSSLPVINLKSSASFKNSKTRVNQQDDQKIDCRVSNEQRNTFGNDWKIANSFLGKDSQFENYSQEDVLKREEVCSRQNIEDPESNKTPEKIVQKTPTRKNRTKNCSRCSALFDIKEQHLLCSRCRFSNDLDKWFSKKKMGYSRHTCNFTP